LTLFNKNKPLGVESMAAPIGNRNAHKGKIFFDALRRAMAGDDHRRLRRAAERLLDLAAEGEPWAIKELADRLDGRPAQETFFDSNADAASLTEIQVTFVTPSANSMIALN